MNNSIDTKAPSNWIFINPDTYKDERVSEYINKYLTEAAKKYGLDQNLVNIAYNEKLKTDLFFENIINIKPFNSIDDKNFKKFLRDWYVSIKTELTKLKNIKDYNVLSLSELNEFILSLGYPYAETLPTRSSKIAFLNSAIELYHKKGTLESLYKILQIYNVKNITISEWWIKHNLNTNTYYAESNVVYPESKRGVELYNSTMEYNRFIENNPHWRLPLKKLRRLHANSGKYKFPSLTSVISVDCYTDATGLNVAYSIFQRKVQETYDYFISHTLNKISTPNEFNSNELKFIKEIDSENSEVLDINSNVFKNESEICINVMMTNRPPKLVEYNLMEGGTDCLVGDNNYYYFIVGPNPSTDLSMDDTAQSIKDVWVSENRKKLVRILKTSDTTAEVYLFDPTEIEINTVFYSDVDSPLYKNSIFQYLSNSEIPSIKVTALKQYDTILRSIIPSEYDIDIKTAVFNGSEILYLDYLLPPQESRKILNAQRLINRQIPLNNYKKLYSVFEIILLISYVYNKIMEVATIPTYFNRDEYHPKFDEILENNPQDGESKILNFKNNDYERYLYYNGEKTKSDNLLTYYKEGGLDPLYIDWINAQYSEFAYKNIKGILTFPKTLPRTDIDNVASNASVDTLYNTITLEYNNIINPNFRHNWKKSQTDSTYTNSSYMEKRLRTNKFLDSFTKPILKYNIYEKDLYNDSLKGLTPLREPEKFLKIVNPDLLSETDSLLQTYIKEVLLENILSDLENYVKNSMALENYNFAYTQTGGAYFNDTLKDIINFFKPFRVKLLDFQTKLLINDPLGDSIIVGDGGDDNNGFYTEYEQTLIEKPYLSMRNIKPDNFWENLLANQYDTNGNLSNYFVNNIYKANEDTYLDNGFVFDNLSGVATDYYEGEFGETTVTTIINVMNNDDNDTNRIVAYPSDEDDLPDNNNWALYQIF